MKDKYKMYDINILSKSDESFDMVILFKSNEDDIENKIKLAEGYRISCGLSILEDENEQQQHQQKMSSDFRNTSINNK